MLVSITEQSSKRERFIQIGKHRHRIPNDHDDYLDEVMAILRYQSKAEALFATSYYGAMMIALLGFVPLKNVRFRALAKGDDQSR